MISREFLPDQGRIRQHPSQQALVQKVVAPVHTVAQLVFDIGGLASLAGPEKQDAFLFQQRFQVNDVVDAHFSPPLMAIIIIIAISYGRKGHFDGVG